MNFEDKLYQVYQSAKLKDRRNIKWTMAMMMPEHVSMLQKEKDREFYISKPILEQWQLEDLQANLMIANEMNNELEMKIWNDGRYKTYKGKMSKINLIKRQFYLTNHLGNTVGPLSLENVVAISSII